ncbi:MAG TPA: PDZ domain-containing protein [Anaerolineae bacterium]|nr:PDZ domain-containing protein [Anaerolineae bacterium]
MQTRNGWQTALIGVLVLALIVVVTSAACVGGALLASSVQGRGLALPLRNLEALTKPLVLEPTPTPPTLEPVPRRLVIEADEEVASARSSIAQACAGLKPAASACEEQLLADIYQRVNPSVVNIRVVKRTKLEQPFRFEFPEIPGFPEIPRMPDEFFQEGVGSGFVWDREGHIVTNNHVVAGAEELEVTFWDDTTLPAQVVGTDPDSDLAVIQVEADPSLLRPVELGDSDDLKVGQRVIAIGNPFGQTGSMTTGIISALGRTIPTGGSPFAIPEMIQTDAAINPGSSGGPLLDSQGRVIGINTLILSRSGSFSGIGFAVPVNIAKRVVPALIEKGEYLYPWLGISGTKLTPAIVEAMDLPVQHGALVVEVVADGPADRAGLRGSDEQTEVFGRPVPIGGDVITAIDGRPVKSMDDLITYLVKEKRPGERVTLTILRDGQEQRVEVTLGQRPRR